MTRKCKKCGVTKPISDFYPVYLNRGNFYRWECKNCFNQVVSKEYQSNRRRENKEKLVEQLGGKCSICGYDKLPICLEFHHLDKKSKGFGFSATIQKITDKKRLNKELKKCILVCANCHREIHSNGYGRHKNSSA